MRALIKRLYSGKNFASDDFTSSFYGTGRIGKPNHKLEHLFIRVARYAGRMERRWRSRFSPDPFSTRKAEEAKDRVTLQSFKL